MPKPKQEQPSQHAVAQRSYHQRQLDRGLVRLSVYVPTCDREAFWEAVDRLRVKWQAKGWMD
jgi:hypothetical protein